MPRTLLWLAAVAALAVPCRGEQTSSSPELLIRLKVRPAPAPGRRSDTGSCLSSTRCIPAIRSRPT